MANPELKIDGLWRQGNFASAHQEDLVFWSREDGRCWLGRLVGDTLRFSLAGTTASSGDAEGSAPFSTGNFTGSGKTEILFRHPIVYDYWLARFTDDEVTPAYAGNTSRFGGAEGVSRVWTGDFTGSGKTEILFWYPGDKNYWLGRFTEDKISYALAGNTAGFGGAESVSLVRVGNFSGSGKSELLFWFAGDGNWWSGRFTGTQLAYSPAGNTPPPDFALQAPSATSDSGPIPS